MKIMRMMNEMNEREKGRGQSAVCAGHHGPVSGISANGPENHAAEDQNMAELYNVIKEAVMDGMNEAIAGNMKNLRGGIYAAIYQAVNAVKKEGQ